MFKKFKFIILGFIFLLFIGAWKVSPYLYLRPVSRQSFNLDDTITQNLSKQYWGLFWFDKSTGRFAYIDSSAKIKFLGDTIYGIYMPDSHLLKDNIDTFNFLYGNKLQIDTIKYSFVDGNIINFGYRNQISVYQNLWHIRNEDSICNVLNFINLTDSSNINQILFTQGSIEGDTSYISNMNFLPKGNILGQISVRTFGQYLYGDSATPVNTKLVNANSILFTLLDVDSIKGISGYKVYPISGIDIKQQIKGDNIDTLRSILYSDEYGVIHIPFLMVDTLVYASINDKILYTDVFPFTTKKTIIIYNDTLQNDYIQAYPNFNISGLTELDIQCRKDMDTLPSTIQMIFVFSIPPSIQQIIKYQYNFLHNAYPDKQIVLPISSVIDSIYLQACLQKDSLLDTIPNMKVKVKFLKNNQLTRVPLGQPIEFVDSCDITDSLSLILNSDLLQSYMVWLKGFSNINISLNDLYRFKYGFSIEIQQQVDTLNTYVFKFGGYSVVFKYPSLTDWIIQ